MKVARLQQDAVQYKIPETKLCKTFREKLLLWGLHCIVQGRLLLGPPPFVLQQLATNWLEVPASFIHKLTLQPSVASVVLLRPKRPRDQDGVPEPEWVETRGMCINVAQPFFETQARENVFSPLRP